MHNIQKSIKDWIVKSLQKINSFTRLILYFSDFIEAFDFSESFTIQSQSSAQINGQTLDIFRSIFNYRIAGNIGGH